MGSLRLPRGLYLHYADLTVERSGHRCPAALCPPPHMECPPAPVRARKPHQPPGSGDPRAVLLGPKEPGK